MVNVVIAGLPKNVKVPKFISFLEKTLFEDGMKVRLTKTAPIDGSLKSITLNMRSEDARKTRRYLNGLSYPYGGKEYILECWNEELKTFGHSRDRDARPSDNNKALSTNGRYSLSPDHSTSSFGIKEELERIDLRIELLKKQRLLMEEENKLLLEKKKLEILQNIGPNDFEQLALYEKACCHNNPAEISQIMARPTPKTKKKNNKKLPNFNTPCKIILSEMKDILCKYDNEENHDMLMSLVGSAIRKRIVIALGGKTFMPASDIVHMYRVWYPHNTDQDLLHELTNTINQSCWPKKNAKNDGGSGQNVTKSDNADKAAKPDNVTEKSEINEEVNTIEEMEKNEEVKKIEEAVINKESESIIVIDAEDNLDKCDVIEKKDKSDIQDLTGNEIKIKDSINEIPLKNLTNIDDFVDMKNDFDEWEDDNSKKEVTEESLSGVVQ
ncbi:uncharacterized protein LOC124540689 [Vanessa cardui]|uniref:uncharacterized protein LOC124540689 n=1 Tax=Vanessa cardui TaxID=171605 RepID=UPI001F146B7B|nr:uncharacterized protein LOC124540689 [Vanessa cardui]